MSTATSPARPPKGGGPPRTLKRDTQELSFLMARANMSAELIYVAIRGLVSGWEAHIPTGVPAKAPVKMRRTSGGQGARQRRHLQRTEQAKLRAAEQAAKQQAAELAAKQQAAELAAQLAADEAAQQARAAALQAAQQPKVRRDRKRRGKQPAPRDYLAELWKQARRPENLDLHNCLMGSMDPDEDPLSEACLKDWFNGGHERWMAHIQELRSWEVQGRKNKSRGQ